MKKEVLKSMNENKVNEMLKNISYFGGSISRNRKCAYNILLKALRKYNLRPSLENDGSLDGSRKAINRWNNGGLQLTKKEIAKCVVANGKYRDFVLCDADSIEFHLSCF